MHLMPTTKSPPTTRLLYRRFGSICANLERNSKLISWPYSPAATTGKCCNPWPRSTSVCVILVPQSATHPVPSRLLVLGAARLVIMPADLGFTLTLGETPHLLCLVLGPCCLKCLFTYVLGLLHNKLYTSIK